jgi:acetolactate synthase-1/3 small subunit
MLYVVLVLAENKPGVLLRVAGILSARGTNIERLSVEHTEDPEVSRITMAFDLEPGHVERVIGKINNLVNVIEAKEVTQSAELHPARWETPAEQPSIM